MKVCKFGGSSMADAESIERVISIIQKDSMRKIVVVSAPGKQKEKDIKVTDLLYTAYQLPDVLDTVAERFRKIAADLNVYIGLDTEFAAIKHNLQQGAGEAYLASRGEYLMAKILAAKLNFTFLDASELFVFKENGIFDAKKTKHVIKAILRKHKEGVVIPGFYGAAKTGEIKTFSRGGSDFSGSVIAGAIHAQVYENFTDVDGIFLANPKIIKNPQKVDMLTYAELRELSYMGAQVLHEDCIFPLKKGKTHIRILNTFNEKSDGTLIVKRAKAIRTVSGISGIKDLCLLTVEKGQMANKTTIVKKVCSLLKEMGIILEFMVTGIDRVSFIVRPFEEEKTDILLQKIKADKVTIERDISAIAVIGKHIAKNAVPEKILNSLSKNKIILLFTSFGVGNSHMLLGVKKVQFEKTIQKLYSKFKGE